MNKKLIEKPTENQMDTFPFFSIILMGSRLRKHRCSFCGR